MCSAVYRYTVWETSFIIIIIIREGLLFILVLSVAMVTCIIILLGQA